MFYEEKKTETERRKPISEIMALNNICEHNSKGYNKGNENCISTCTSII